MSDPRHAAEQGEAAPDRKETMSDVELLNRDALHLAIFRRMEAMIENPDEHGIYPTTEFMEGLKSDILGITTQAVGYLSAELAARADAWNGNAPDWFPEPPEWLELWDKALATAEADANS